MSTKLPKKLHFVFFCVKLIVSIRTINTSMGGRMNRPKDKAGPVFCPDCGAEIRELLITRTYTLHLMKEGVDYRLDKKYNQDPEYCCPCCDAVLAEEESDAKKILMGK